MREPLDRDAATPGGHDVRGVYADGALVGGCMGFHVKPFGLVPLSHIAVVLTEHARGGVGRAIKEHQRAWCRERGIETIRSTYDSMLARHAH